MRLIREKSSVSIESIAQVAGSTWRISFPDSLEPGEYSLSLGPVVSDLAGNLMDVDGDGIQGEADEDVFVEAFTLSDGVGPTVVEITPSGLLNEAIKVIAIEFSEPIDFSTFTASDLDITTPSGIIDWRVLTAAQTGPTTVEVSIPTLSEDGDYSVLFTPSVRDTLGNVATGKFSREFSIDLTAPQVVEFRRLKIDSFEVEFSEPIPDLEFAGTDIILTAPSGIVTVSEPTRTSETMFLISLSDMPLVEGEYQFQLGPEIRDVAGNAMEQAFTANFQVSYPDLGFDTKDANSIVALDAATFGETISIEWTVNNFGNASAETGWIDSVWLSRDGVIDADDTLLRTTELTSDRFFFGPTPYLQRSDSPFNEIQFDEFYLDDFESGELTVPGVTFDFARDFGIGSGLAVFTGGSTRDSVDEDDGVIDGSGQFGGTLSPIGNPIGASAQGVEFFFDPDVLGGLPTHAGLVWTDATPNDTVVFEAIDVNGDVIVSQASPGIGDNSHFGSTAEDRFFGAAFVDGIASIRIYGEAMNQNNFEIDHLQYGFASPDQILAGALPAFVQYTNRQDITLPLGVEFAEGTWQLLVQTDSNNVVQESNESNNIAASTIELALPETPDLTPTISAPSDLQPGDTFDVAWKVTNSGEVAAIGTWVDRVFVAPNGDRSNAIELTSREWISGLEVGDSYNQSVSVELPELVDGDYEIYVVTDMEQSIFEAPGGLSNEAIAAPSLVVTHPDLTPTIVSSPDSGATGQAVEVVWTTTNIGTGATQSGWTDSIYLSSDGTFDESDRLLAEFVHPSGIEAGATATGSANFILPIDLPGDHQIIVVSDSNNEIREADGEEDNSESSSTFNITRTPLPAYVVTGVEW